MNSKPSIRIVSPALAAANNGNWHTARRWQRFLSPVARVDIALDWDGAAADLLIALHARRSAASIRRWREWRPRAPLVLVLIGTDLYRDLPAGDADAARSLATADRLVVLQPEALAELPAEYRPRARCIVQSASRVLEPRKARRSFDFVAVGHLRPEKDPLTVMEAVRRIPAGSPIRLLQVGGPLDPALADAARRTAVECPRYRWLGALPHEAARRRIARSRALVHASIMEGGANAVIEAVRSRVPVLASRMGGNLGLLGPDYGGYFPVGDAGALAELMQRFAADPAFAESLARQCAQREPDFDPACERAAVRAVVAEVLGAGGERDRD